MQVIQVEKLMQSDPSGRRLSYDKKYEKGVVFVDGNYYAPDEPVVPIVDAGFLHSDATYEYAVVSRGRIFRLQDHFERFALSCDTFRLRNPYTEAQMRVLFTTLLRTTGLRDAGIWWAVTRGIPKPGTAAIRDRIHPDAFENRFYAAAYPYASLATQEQRDRGLSVLISKTYIRIPTKAVSPTAKNFHWMDMKLSLFEARDHGADWSVLTDSDGYLAESPGANIFAIRRGELYTPESGCLLGITRKTALEFAQMLGVTIHVGKVHAEDLRAADDAFITSSGGGIIPVNSVDGILLGGTDGPGDLAIQLHNMYWEKLWSGWKSEAIVYGASAVT